MTPEMRVGAHARSGARAARAGAGRGHERVRAVIDIQHGALRAFEQHRLAVADGLVQQRGGVAHHGPDALGERLVLVANGRQVHLLVDAQRPGDGDLLLHHRVVLSAEDLPVQQVGDADAAPRDLVLVARPDAARRGPDGNPPRPPFRHLLHQPVHRKQHVRAVADEQVPAHRDAGRFQRLDLREQRRRIDHQPVADHGLLPRPQDAARNQLQNELLLADEHRVAGVVPALIAGDDIEALGEEIDDLPLALVSPLGA